METYNFLDIIQNIITECVEQSNKIISDEHDHLFVQIMDRHAYDDVTDIKAKIKFQFECENRVENKGLTCLFSRAYFYNNYIICYGITTDDDDPVKVLDKYSKSDNKCK